MVDMHNPSKELINDRAKETMRDFQHSMATIASNRRNGSDISQIISSRKMSNNSGRKNWYSPKVHNSAEGKPGKQKKEMYFSSCSNQKTRFKSTNSDFANQITSRNVMLKINSISLILLLSIKVKMVNFKMQDMISPIVNQYPSAIEPTQIGFY